MSDSLGIVIPDYKSDFLEEVIKSALTLNPEKIISIVEILINPMMTCKSFGACLKRLFMGDSYHFLAYQAKFEAILLAI